MKTFITPSYTFTPGAAGVGTVNLSGIAGFDAKYLIAIINQTRGVVIYSTGSQTNKYSSISGSTLTLGVDTTGHSAGDVLQVVYEDLSAIAVSTGLTQPLTDTQLRATAVPVSGTVTANTGLTQPLTDTQLRATAVPVSGSVSVSNFPASQVVVQTAMTASFQEITNLTTTAQTITPPASAKWVKVYAEDGNTANIRVRLAGTATITSGVQLQPGRAEDFNVVGSGISVIAESGTNQKINFTFGA